MLDYEQTNWYMYWLQISCGVILATIAFEYENIAIIITRLLENY